MAEFERALHHHTQLDDWLRGHPPIVKVGAVYDWPGIELLVTSREKLKLRAEQLLPIGGLTYPLLDKTIELEQTAESLLAELK